MALNLEEVIANCFRAVPPVFTTGEISPKADEALYAYVRYWVELDSPRERVMLRCERLIHNMYERAAIPRGREADVPRIAAALTGLCAHHYAGLSALRHSRPKTP